MLTSVAPPGLDPEATKASLDGDGLRINLPHRTESDLSVEVSASGEQIIVGTFADHHHFEARGWEDYTPGGPHEKAHWYSHATGYIADVLRGRLVIETTFKGRLPVHSKVTHHDERGERLGVCHEGIPFVWRLFFFWPTRREVRTPTFME